MLRQCLGLTGEAPKKGPFSGYKAWHLGRKGQNPQAGSSCSGRYTGPESVKLNFSGEERWSVLWDSPSPSWERDNRPDGKGEGKSCFSLPPAGRKAKPRVSQQR